MKYAVIERELWGAGTQPVAETPGAMIVRVSDLYGVVEHITGRSSVLKSPTVQRQLRNKGRVYIAGARDCRGVLVEKMPASDLTG